MACYTFARCTLMLLNVLFVLVGLFLAAVGVFILIAFELIVDILSMDDFVKEMIEVLEETGNEDMLKIHGIYILCVGVSMTVICIIGFAGGLCKGQCLLYSFLVFSGLVLIAEIGFIVHAVIDRDGVQSNVVAGLEKSILEYEGNGMHFDTDGVLVLADKDTSHVSFAWDYMQIEAGCCGATETANWSSFNGTYTLPGTTLPISAKVPLSCCKTDDFENYPDEVDKITFLDAESCLASASDEATNTKGCSQSVFEEIWQFNVIFASTIGGVIFAQLLTLVCALCVVRQASLGTHRAV